MINRRILTVAIICICVVGLCVSGFVIERNIAERKEQSTSGITEFVGSWGWISSDESSSLGFTLTVASSSSTLHGDYCATEDYGRFSDCDPGDNSAITAHLNGKILSVTIHDNYGGGTGEATIELNGDRSLMWILVTPPEGFNHLPRTARLVRDATNS